MEATRLPTTDRVARLSEACRAYGRGHEEHWLAWLDRVLAEGGLGAAEAAIYRLEGYRLPPER